MKLELAQEILTQFHNNPTPVCVVINSNGTINGQLPTGLPNEPFLPINDSMVSESDLLTIMDMYTAHPPENKRCGAGLIPSFM